MHNHKLSLHLYRPILYMTLIGSFSAIAAEQSAMATDKETVDSSLAIETILVTATKRKISLNDTSLAISAYNSKMMDDLGISTGADYLNLTPSLSYNSNPARIFIRGVGLQDNQPGVDSGVALYVDGIYSNNALDINRSSFDTQRIEIVRGPQGTLFGRNATGGAVSIVTKRPTEKTESTFRMGLGSFNTQKFNFATSGSLSDEMRYRASIGTESRDGYINNLGGPDLDSMDAENWNVGIEYDFSDNIQLFTRAYGSRANHISAGDLGYQLSPYYSQANITALGGSPAGVVVGTGEGDPNISFLYANLQDGYTTINPSVNDPRTVDLNSVPIRDTETLGFLVDLTWDIGATTLRYIGGYEDAEVDVEGEDLDRTSRLFDIDTDGKTGGQLEISLLDTGERTSHELQLLSNNDGPLNWVLGAYYYKEDRQLAYWQRDVASANLDSYGDNSNPSAETLGIINFKPRTLYYQYGDLDAESYAFFADLAYNINDQWSLKGGLRYSYDEKVGQEEQFIATDSGNRFNGAFGPGGHVFANNDLRTLTDNWEDVSGRLVLEYTPDEDTLMYANISTGYKPGGMLLGGFIEAAGIDPIFDKETLINYELGYKVSIDDRWQINTAAFFSDYNDMQVKTTVLNPVTLSNIDAAFNAEKSEIYGLEIESTYLVSENLRVMASYSYNHSEFVKTDNYVNTYFGRADDGPVSIEGNSLLQTPENKLSLRADYTLYSSIGDLRFAGQFAFVDEQEFRIFNESQVRTDSYENIDLFLTWTQPENQSFWVQFYLKNAGDNDSVTTKSAERKHIVQGAANTPRSFGVTVNYGF